MRCTPTPRSIPVRQSGLRAGLTLLELLLVISILVIVVGLSLPAIEEANGAREMDQAAEEMRQAIAEGRRRAIENGVVYQFRYEPGGSKFIVVPDRASLSSEEDREKIQGISGEFLGGNVRIQQKLDEAGPAERLDREQFEGMEDWVELSRSAWSKPIEFSYEGDATDATFYLLLKDQRYVKFSVRGLTAAVSVSRVKYQAED